MHYDLKISTMNYIQKVNLGNICQLSFGQHLKSKDEGDTQYLQVKNFSEDGTFLNNVESYVDADAIKPSSLLIEGDVIFVSKGMKFFAYKYESKIGKAVASSVFYIMKVDEAKVLSDYLVCILNQPKSLAYFYGASAGSSIPSIRKKELLDFQIPLPSLEEQKKIADFYNNHIEQQRMLSEIKTKNQIIFNQAIHQLTQVNN